MKIKIGTRKSDLAIAQTKLVISEIKKINPDVECEVVEMSTKGDLILDKPLLDFGGKGVFVTEFEEAILNGDIDIAVHSGKDLPTVLADGLEIIANPKREEPCDVIVFAKGTVFNETDKFIIGTGSERRAKLVTSLYSNIECKPVRGNVPTRLRKMLEGEFDGVILACAGLNRLGIKEEDKYNFLKLDTKDFVPAGAQGIIAIEGRTGNPVNEIVSQISHKETELCFKAERKILDILEANCHEAVGIYSFIEDENINISGFLGNSGIKRLTSSVAQWEKCCEELAGGLK